MTKQFKSVSLMLCLLAMSTGSAMATTSAAPISAPVVQQSETATGTVVDAMGPVIGASVVVKGTTNGVITDFDGNFSLSNVKKGDVIQVSFVGYATQEIVWDGKVMNITLKEDTEVLEEVVVVGYGTMRKKDLTGAVVQINPDKISDNLKKQNAYIPGVKPGEATAQYISKVLFKITLLGATYLTVLASLPMVVGLIFTDLPASVQIGGTSLMIVVGVAVETYKQIKTASQSQEYHGFM